MRTGFDWKNVIRAMAIPLPLLLFWMILSFQIPYSFTRYFNSYSLVLFLIVLFLFWLLFRLPDPYGTLACFGLIMMLFALTLSFKWTSGYSDNKVIGGFLPYKDGGGYYFGANLILKGLPVENTVQSGWRPLFPGFLSSTLFFLGGNLKWALAVLVLLAGIGSYISSHQILRRLGPLSASLYITFLYFYIQTLIGLTMTELLGFTLGCFAFLLLWRTYDSLKLLDLLLGLAVLVLALSVRAGTFLMLPFLALWAGRIFRGKKSFSFSVFAIAIIVILASYFLVNSIYSKLVGIPDGTVFGNFAYSIYGQVHGGAGWHSAIEELGTRKPSAIYPVAFQYFLKHPFSLLIGFAKAYRDFFLPGDYSMFVFNVNGHLSWANYAAWGIVIVLFVLGIIRLIREITLSLNLLFLAGFLGFFLSIPFLPPIDGGARFYASTVPFFFVIPVIVLGRSLITDDTGIQTESFDREMNFLRVGATVLSVLTFIVPVILFKLNQASSFIVPECPHSQEPFAIKSYPDSYVELVYDNNDCGLVPKICLSDFDMNSVERTVDDFYQKLYGLANESKTDVRIIPAVDLVDRNFYYFFISSEKLQSDTSSNLILGCATRIRTKNQRIYQVESVVTEGK